MLQIIALGAYLDIFGIRTLGHMENHVKDLAKMKETIDALKAEYRSKRQEEFIVTTYKSDEKEVWRQFRRKLITEGFSRRA